MNTRFVTNPTQSAADDAETEQAINGLPDDELFALQAYAAAWDEANADGQEEEQNRLALVRPMLPWRFLLPIAIVSIGLIYLAWGV